MTSSWHVSLSLYGTCLGRAFKSKCIVLFLIGQFRTSFKDTNRWRSIFFEIALNNWAIFRSFFISQQQEGAYVKISYKPRLHRGTPSIIGLSEDERLLRRVQNRPNAFDHHSLKKQRTLACCRCFTQNTTPHLRFI